MQRKFFAFVLVLMAAAMVSAQEARFRFPSDPFSGGPEKPTAASPGMTETGAAEGDVAGKDGESYRTRGTEMSPVQQNAWFKADQRRRRIETRNWYGLSASRPVVSASPHLTAYNQTWQRTYYWQPYSWYSVYWH